MILAHKIVLNPTRSQERLLWEHVGYARFAPTAPSRTSEKNSIMVNGGTTKRSAHAGTHARLNWRHGQPTSARTRPRTPYAMWQGGLQVGRVQACSERRQTCAIRRLSWLAQVRRTRLLPGGQWQRHSEGVRTELETPTNRLGEDARGTQVRWREHNRGREQRR